MFPTFLKFHRCLLGWLPPGCAAHCRSNSAQDEVRQKRDFGHVPFWHDLQIASPSSKTSQNCQLVDKDWIEKSRTSATYWGFSGLQCCTSTEHRETTELVAFILLRGTKTFLVMPAPASATWPGKMQFHFTSSTATPQNCYHQ